MVDGWIDPQNPPAQPVRLDLKGPITIEGEDRFSSVIRLKENSTGSGDDDQTDQVVRAMQSDPNPTLFSGRAIAGPITFRNFTSITGAGSITSIVPRTLSR